METKLGKISAVIEQEPIYGAMPKRRYCIREGLEPDTIRFEVLYESRHALALNAKLRGISKRCELLMGDDGHFEPWLIVEIEAAQEAAEEVRQVLRLRFCEYAVIDPALLVGRPRALARPATLPRSRGQEETSPAQLNKPS